jgi:hypothetical protein
VLGTGAGIAQVGLDFLNLKDEMNGKQRGVLMTLYVTRMITTGVSTYYGLLAARSYSGPMIQYAAKRAGRVVAIETTEVVAKLAARRVLLLLRVARFNAAGLAITAAELAYYGYVNFIADDELQKWCLQSTFRTKKIDTSLFGFKRENTYFFKEEDEIKALEKATQEVFGG